MKYRLFIKGQREQEVTQDELKENHLYAIVWIILTTWLDMLFQKNHGKEKRIFSANEWSVQWVFDHRTVCFIEAEIKVLLEQLMGGFGNQAVLKKKNYKIYCNS